MNFFGVAGAGLLRRVPENFINGNGAFWNLLYLNVNVKRHMVIVCRSGALNVVGIKEL